MSDKLHEHDESRREDKCSRCGHSTDISDVENSILNVGTRITYEMASVLEKIKNVEEGLSSLQNERTWMIRLVMGAVVLAVISLVITNGDYVK